MIRRPPRSTQSRSSAASDVYKRQFLILPICAIGRPTSGRARTCGKRRFPFAPRQASLVSFVGAGVPAVVFAAFAIPGPTPKLGLFRLLARFFLPTTLLMALMGASVYLAYALPAKASYLAAHPGAGQKELIEFAYPHAQTALTLFSCFAAILLLLLAVPPSRWFGGGAVVRGAWRIPGVVIPVSYTHLRAHE